MSGDGDPEEQARRVRNMQDLLKFCVHGTAAEDTTGPVRDMDPERKAWLEEAIKAYSVDIIQEMLESIATIKRELDVLDRSAGELNRDEGSSIETISEAVDILVERTEDLDIASDFEKIGGFSIITPLLLSPYSEVQLKGAELVGELVQNHDACCAAAINNGVLNMLVKLIDSGAGDSVKTKALYATSCLIRSNAAAQEDFVANLDGFSVLLRAMQISSAEALKLRTKASFLLSLIIGGRPDFKVTLLKMGFVDQLVGLLHQEHDQSHEHILSALLAFITDFSPALEEATRPELQLMALLQQRLVIVDSKPEFAEGKSIVGTF